MLALLPELHLDRFSRAGLENLDQERVDGHEEEDEDTECDEHSNAHCNHVISRWRVVKGDIGQYKLCDGVGKSPDQSEMISMAI